MAIEKIEAYNGKGKEDRTLAGIVNLDVVKLLEAAPREVLMSYARKSAIIEVQTWIRNAGQDVAMKWLPGLKLDANPATIVDKVSKMDVSVQKAMLAKLLSMMSAEDKAALVGGTDNDETE